MSLNYGGLFEPWEIQLTKKVVAKFRNEWRCLRQDDLEDLVDDCLIHWLTVKQKVSLSDENNSKSYLSVVLKNKLQNLAAERESLKRRPYFRSTSLNEFLESYPESPFLADPNKHNPILESELNSKMESVMEKLTQKQKRICQVVQSGEMTITQLSIQMSVSRKHIHEEIGRIRKTFEQEGLREYL